MAEQDPLPPMNGMDQFQIDKMIDRQIERFYDHARMLSFWRRLLAGDNDPEEIAKGICTALSAGRYERIAAKKGAVTINISVSGDANPQAFADALASALPAAARL